MHDNGKFSKIVKDVIHEDGNSFQLVKTFYHIALKIGFKAYIFSLNTFFINDTFLRWTRS
jgi:hypothetical protein